MERKKHMNVKNCARHESHRLCHRQGCRQGRWLNFWGRYLSGFVLTGALFFACDTGTGPNTVDPDRKDWLDLAYGSHAAQKLDLFFPDAPSKIAGPVAAALYIHGGAWITGDKTDYPAELIKSMAADAGIAAAAMNYRLLFAGASCDDMIRDVSSAVALIKQQAAQLGVTIDRLSIIGVSAGAHLALLYSYTRAGSGTDSPIPVTLCVSLSGPTDFTDPAWFNTSASPEDKILLISALTGQPFTESDLTAMQNGGDLSPDKRQALERISPVYQIHSNIPPTLFAHGTRDPIVPISNAYRLDAALYHIAPDKNVGLTVFPHSGHGLDAPADALISATFLAKIKEELEQR